MKNRLTERIDEEPVSKLNTVFISKTKEQESSFKDTVFR